jgi:hypothetical protein
MVTVYTIGVPEHCAKTGVMVYLTTASVDVELFTNESVILPDPDAVLPVAEPDITCDVQLYWFAPVTTGWKISRAFEQRVTDESLPTNFLMLTVSVSVSNG